MYSNNIRSGRMRHFIEFFVDNGEPDEWGDPALTFVFDTRANVLTKSGSQNNELGVPLTTQVITILTRHDDRADNGQTVRWKGLDYEVQHVKPDEKEHSMIVIAQRVAK